MISLLLLGTRGGHQRLGDDGLQVVGLELAAGDGGQQVQRGPAVAVLNRLAS
jgi:hypothetical protein